MANPDRNLYDPPYDDALLYDNEMEPDRPRSRPLIALLGFVVLAAFAGVVWVAYNQGVQQGQRGVNPPVLSADNGPTRIDSVPSSSNPAPKKSYDRLLANADDAAGQETVLPGPEQPRAIASTQDIVSGGKPVTGQDNYKGGPVDEPPPFDPRMDSTVDMQGGIAAGSPPVEMTAPSLSRREDITQSLPGPDSSYEPEAAPVAPPKTASPKPSIAQTPPSGARPITTAITAPSSPVAEAPVETAPEPSIDAPPAAAGSSGKISIQLGSFPDAKQAAAQWSRVKSSHQDLLSAYSPEFVQANVEGKGVRYRLRVGGFSDKATAKSVCGQLQASGQDCFVPGK